MKAKIFIVTGISGAGKSQTIKCFEDLGFFCVDNLPTTLTPKFAELVEHFPGRLNRIALGIDVREGELLKDLFSALQELKEMGHSWNIIFLDASDDVLVHRFSETRRKHPLGRSVIEGIRAERKLMAEIKEKADTIIDTSRMNLMELKAAVASASGSLKKDRAIAMSIVSFGYKYGIPVDADIVMDVRFLANPNYEKRLKNHTGNKSAVSAFVFREKKSRDAIQRFFSFVNYLIPFYHKEGKSYLTIAIGCTGGKHRSVAVTNRLKEYLGKKNIPVKVFHRDIEKG